MDDRIEKLKNNLELMNSNIADDLTVRVENWIIENKITRPEAEKILEKMTKGLFLHDRLEVILDHTTTMKMNPKQCLIEKYLQTIKNDRRFKFTRRSN